MQRLSGVLRQRVDGQKGAPTDLVPERELNKDIVSLSQIRGAFACALLPIHMAISGGDSNVARERVSIPCAKHAGMRQWRVARNADAFRTRTVDGPKYGGTF